MTLELPGHERADRRGNKQRLWHAAVSAFLLFHLIAITCWAVPFNTPLVSAIRTFIRPYMLWSGLFQSWDTFAPTPRQVNAYVEAAVITADGRIHNWKFPRMEQLSVTGRYFKERYRKFSENLQEQSSSALWPDVARHLARMYNNPANPAQIVLLVRYWSEIPPPSAVPYKPGEGRARIFFEYRVKPEDLQ
ncbi:MAG: hypothetical protein JO270_18045 [Acidobacteriaceae bacterium]|nr:hypothetical protein [Acidobacteriaceae bacterium]MBV8573310.1 hypothetical protein [Acidobacteriaceae bacterium]